MSHRFTADHDGFADLDEQIKDITDQELSLEGLLYVLDASSDKFEAEWKEVGVSGALEIFDIPISHHDDIADAWTVVYHHSRMDTPKLRYTLGRIDVKSIDAVDGSIIRKNDIADASFRETVCGIAESFSEGGLTAREFYSYHLMRLYSSSTVADILSDLLESDISGSSVRKSRSRADDKRVEAEHRRRLLDEQSDDPMEIIFGPSSREGSPLSDHMKSEMVRGIERAQRQKDVMGIETEIWEPLPGTEVSYMVENDHIAAHINIELSEFSTPIIVDRIQRELETDLATTAGRAENLTELSPRHAELYFDIVDVVMHVFGEDGIDKGRVTSPVATGAYEGTGEDGEPFARFESYFHFTDPEPIAPGQ